MLRPPLHAKLPEATMSAYTSSTPAPSFARAALALLVTLLAIGGALIGALLLATGALLTVGLRALGIGRRPSQGPTRQAPAAHAPAVIEGEFRVIESDSKRHHPPD